MNIRLSKMVNRSLFTGKALHFLTFCTCFFITDRSIASSQEISLSLPVEDKLATPDLGHHVLSKSTTIFTVEFGYAFIKRRNHFG